MKIIIIGSFPPPYHGSSIYLKNLTELLKRDGEFEVISINCSDRENDLSNMGRWTIRNVYFGIKALVKLSINLIFKKIDLVYIPISQNKLAFLRDGLYILISKIFGSKILIHLHGSYFLEFYNRSDILYKKFIDLTMNLCSGVIVLGDSLKYIFEKWFDNSKIKVLPNFVEEIEINDLTKKENNIVFSYLGNIIESKGIFQLLESLKELINKGYNVKLKIAGKFGKDPFTGKTELETKNLFFEMIENLRENIEYYGLISNTTDKIKFLMSSDVFVFPSWLEGQPLVILEAMSCGLSVISTRNVGVIDDTVIDGYNGILISKNAVNELTEAMEKLIISKDLRKKMSENSYKLYKEKYTPSEHLKNFKLIIKEILNE